MDFNTNFEINSPEILLPRIADSDITLTILREDLIHPIVSGNKFRKLKYNIEEAQQLKSIALLTFGGAFSNHIAATAAAGKLVGLKTIGIIRGEELQDNYTENETLKYATSCGMHLHFISRADYKLKDTEGFINKLKIKFGDFYLLPEGGTNQLAVKGCTEILNTIHIKYDYICCSVGTGGTLAGLIEASGNNQKTIGFSALKGTFQSLEISKYTSKTNFEIRDDYCFGGYGKIDSVLVRFINEFNLKFNIPLDPIYTGKMLFGVTDLINKGYFKENSRILAVHTGGLQGIAGINNLLKKNNLSLINV